MGGPGILQFSRKHSKRHENSRRSLHKILKCIKPNAFKVSGQLSASQISDDILHASITVEATINERMKVRANE